MKKKILIILSILLVLFIINTTRNYIIINKIFNKQREYKNCTNYSFEKIDFDKSKINIKYKDGNVIIETDKNDKFWYNKENKEAIYYNEKEKTAKITTQDFIVGADLPFSTKERSFGRKNINVNEKFNFYQKY